MDILTFFVLRWGTPLIGCPFMIEGNHKI